MNNNPRKKLKPEEVKRQRAFYACDIDFEAIQKAANLAGLSTNAFILKYANNAAKAQIAKAQKAEQSKAVSHE